MRRGVRRHHRFAPGVLHDVAHEIDDGARAAQKLLQGAQVGIQRLRRSFDILHVATARVLKATAMLTFDINQRKLASAVRLAVGP